MSDCATAVIMNPSYDLEIQHYIVIVLEAFWNPLALQKYLQDPSARSHRTSWRALGGGPCQFPGGGQRLKSSWRLALWGSL